MQRFALVILLLFFTVRLEAIAAGRDVSRPPNFPSQVRFIENRHQWDPFIRFKAGFRGGQLFLTDTAFTFVFEHPDDLQALHPGAGRRPDSIRFHALDVIPVGALRAETVPSDSEAYYHNYFKGQDPSRWASRVRLFHSVTYQELYRKIDMKFYSSFSDVKYDFVVHPGGDPSRIRLEYRGAEQLSLLNGELHIRTSVGEVVLQSPYAYQQIDGHEKKVRCRFELKEDVLQFDLPDGYDSRYDLIIDPTLVFSSFTGSTSDNWGFTATYDASGNLYSGGNVADVGYPATPGAYQLAFAGGSGAGNGFSCDMAIAKFNASGTALLYATYLGGSDNEQPQSLIVDASQQLAIFGTTTSSNFPVTAGAYQTTWSGSSDIVVCKLSVNGDSLVASTFVGGSLEDGLNTSPDFTVTGPLKYNYSDESRGEIITYSGAYIVGSSTKSSDFPVTPGCLQAARNGIQDGVLFMLNGTLTGMLWCTYLGGSGEDAVYDILQGSNNDLYVCGGTTSADFAVTAGALHTSYQGGRADGFITRIGSAGVPLLASSYMGTSSYDQTYFIETDAAGDIYATGQTEGAYPITSGVYSDPNSGQFIHKLDAVLSTTYFSTIFGSGTGVPNISPTAFLVDTCRNIYVAGWGRCLDLGVFVPGNNQGMPITANAFQPTTDGCDFYFIVLNSAASSVVYATYFGGAASSEHVDGGTSRFDKNGVIYESVCAGCGGQSDFPTTPGVVSTTNNSVNCNNGVIKLAFELSRTVAAATATPASGCAPLIVGFDNASINAEAFLWDFDDGTPVDTARTPVHVFTVPGTYQVRLIALNTASCSGSDTAYVTVNVTGSNPPDASFALNTTLTCDSLSLDAVYTGSSGSFFSWSIDATGVSGGTAIQYTLTDTGFHEIVLIVSDTTCPSLPDTALQTVYFPPPVDAVAGFTPDADPCLPEAVQFNSVGSSPSTYQWDFGDGTPESTAAAPQHTYLSPGTYYVLFIAENLTSCNQRDTVVIPITVAPPVLLDTAFLLIPPAACDTFDVQFAANPAPGVLYEWQLGDGTDTNAATFIHQYPAPGNYIVSYTVTDTICNQQLTSTRLVHLRSSVSASISINGNQSGCAPQTVVLSNASAATGAYSWDLGNGTQSTDTAVTVTYTQPGDYALSLTVYDPLSCNGQATDSFLLSVFPSPTALFEASPQLGYDFTEVTLENRSLQADSFRWEFGDGTFSSEQDVIHRYTSPGVYRICLFATSSNGCVDSSCTEVTQEAAESLFLPNCFTPNGDGRNEVFKVETVGIVELKVRIYNRWGRLIHEFETPQGFWDGMTNGIPAPEAVYEYQLKAIGSISGPIERVGRVTLLR